MKLLLSLITGLLVGAASVYVWLPDGHDHGVASMAGDSREILYYRNPMDSSVTSDVPARDHMGMEYIPVYADRDDDTDEPGLRIHPELQLNLGVRLAEAEQGDLKEIRHAPARVAYAESDISRVDVRAEGWVEDLQVRTAGAEVQRGQVLFRLDSPRLRTAQEELLQSLRRGNGVEPARDRLRALGMHDQDIQLVERRKQILQWVPVRARQSGVVQNLTLLEGSYVMPGSALMTLAGRDPVWVVADLFEADLQRLDPDQPATVTLPLQPGSPRDARIDYLYPELSTSGRTARARLVLANPDGLLRPGMLAEVSLATRPLHGVIHVPADAVIRTGRQNRIVLQLPDGRFQVREVRTGPRIGDRQVIEEGLQPGDPVVVSGQFLLDSESRVTVSLERLRERAAEVEKNRVWATGEVRRFDPEARTASLQHEPVAEWSWPAMTMGFELDPALDVSSWSPGMALRFAMTELPEGGFRITAWKPVSQEEEHHHD